MIVGEREPRLPVWSLITLCQTLWRRPIDFRVTRLLVGVPALIETADSLCHPNYFSGFAVSLAGLCLSGPERHKAISEVALVSLVNDGLLGAFSR